MKTIFYPESIAIVATMRIIVATISVPALLFGKRAFASIDEQGNYTIANDTNMAATTTLRVLRVQQ